MADDPREYQELTKNQRVEALFKGADFCWTRFDKRATLVWKIYFGVWTSLALLIGFVITGQITVNREYLIIGCSAFSLLLFIVHVLYIWEHGKANKLDRDQFHEYYEDFQKEIEFKHSPQVQCRIQRAREASPTLNQYANRFAWVVTALLGIALVFVSTDVHPNNAQEPGKSIQSIPDGIANNYIVGTHGNQEIVNGNMAGRDIILLSEPADDSDFMVQFLATMLGVLATTMITLVGYYLKKAWEDRKERRSIRALWLLILRKNRAYVVQMLTNEFPAGQIPTYEFDTNSLQLTSHHLNKYLSETEVENLERARVEMIHANAKLNDLRAMHRLVSIRRVRLTSTPYAVNDRVGSVKCHLKDVKDYLESAISCLECRI